MEAVLGITGCCTLGRYEVCCSHLNAVCSVTQGTQGWEFTSPVG